MMRKVVKQVAGIDVAQKELVVTLGRMLDDFSIELFSYKVFKKSSKSVLALLYSLSSIFLACLFMK